MQHNSLIIKLFDTKKITNLNKDSDFFQSSYESSTSLDKKILKDVKTSDEHNMGLKLKIFISELQNELKNSKLCSKYLSKLKIFLNKHFELKKDQDFFIEVLKITDNSENINQNFLKNTRFDYFWEQYRNSFSEFSKRSQIGILAEDHKNFCVFLRFVALIDIMCKFSTLFGHPIDIVKGSKLIYVNFSTFLFYLALILIHVIL